MLPEETTLQEENESKNNQERYAEELNGPDDYWLTITDAARATRRQDVTIRRWISKGVLPVRRQNVGLNQRTRLVRASDLSALTPIIDPAGAITSERGKLDLTSIPVQQAQIKASQQDILAQIEALHAQLKNDVETLMRGLTTQWTELQEAFVSVHNDIAQSAESLQKNIDEYQRQTELSLQQQQSDYQQALKVQQTRTKTILSGFKEELQSLLDQQTQLASRVKEQTEEAQAQFQNIMSSIQQSILQAEGLAKLLEQLSTTVAEQESQLMQEKLLVAEQQKQIQSLTDQVSLQSQQLEQEVKDHKKFSQLLDQYYAQVVAHQEQIKQEAALRMKLESHLSQLDEHYANRFQEYEQTQQILVTSLSEHQEHISYLEQQTLEQQQKFEALLQDYVKLKEKSLGMRGKDATA